MYQATTVPGAAFHTTHARCRAVCVADKFREHRFDGVDDEEDRPLIAQFCGNCPETVVSHIRGQGSKAGSAYTSISGRFLVRGVDPNRRATKCTSSVLLQTSGAVVPPVHTSVAWKMLQMEEVTAKSSTTLSPQLSDTSASRPRAVCRSKISAYVQASFGTTILSCAVV